MRKITIALATLTLLATGCGRSLSQIDPNTPVELTHRHARVAVIDSAPETETPAATPDEAVAQKPGDYVTYRFSGSFRKTPLTLIQRVVDVKGSMMTVDITLKEGTRSDTLRARFDSKPGSHAELAGVFRLEGGEEKAVSNDAYDTLMSRTILAADRNEELLATENVDVTVSGHSIACTKTSYRVVVGKSKATMSTLTSDAFPWGDLGGEIRRDDGRVLYRAEVTDVGNDAPGAQQVAQAEQALP